MANTGDDPGKAYLSVCTMYRDHARYLREWIEFHRLVGAERFFLYDNGSKDDHREALAPYLEDGTVVLHDWTGPVMLTRAFQHCIGLHRDESRWIAFLDIDEFLFSPSSGSVADVLTGFEQFPGVGVNRINFGTSGHGEPPPGLVIENYTWTTRRRPHVIKSIVDPRRVKAAANPHFFVYEDGGVAVDENRGPIDPDRPLRNPEYDAAAFTRTFSASQLRINHYVMKSEAEYRNKLLRGWPDRSDPRPTPQDLETFFANANEVRDEAILGYLPRLREALAERERRAAPPLGSD